MKKIFLALGLLSVFGFADSTKMEISLRIDCERGNAESCFSLANAHMDGLYVEKDVDKALSYYRDSCDLKLADGCFELGQLYLRLGKYKDAQKYIERSCDYGDGDGCYLGGAMLSTGMHTVKNPDKALKYYSQACEFDIAEACTLAGASFSKIDNTVAEHFYKKACDLNSANGCTYLGELLSRKEDSESVYYLSRACDMSNGLACYLLSGMFRQGHLVEQDEYKAGTLLKEACYLDITDACVGAGDFYLTRHHEMALNMYRKACTAGIGAGCKGVGYLYIPGFVKSGIKPDIGIALKYFKQGCDLKSHDSCDAYKKLLKKELGGFKE